MRKVPKFCRNLHFDSIIDSVVESSDVRLDPISFRDSEASQRIKQPTPIRKHYTFKKNSKVVSLVANQSKRYSSITSPKVKAHSELPSINYQNLSTLDHSKTFDTSEKDSENTQLKQRCLRQEETIQKLKIENSELERLRNEISSLKKNNVPKPKCADSERIDSKHKKDSIDEYLVNVFNKGIGEEIKSQLEEAVKKNDELNDKCEEERIKNEKLQLHVYALGEMVESLKSITPDKEISESEMAQLLLKNTGLASKVIELADALYEKSLE